MILIGWMIVSGLERSHRFFGWISGILLGMIALAALSEAGMMFLALKMHNLVTRIDVVAISGVGIAVTITALLFYRYGIRAAAACLVAATALLMPLVMGLWISQLPLQNPRTIARRIEQTFGDADYVFFGPNVSLPLCFNLREKIPWAQELPQLPPLVHPGTVVIAQTKSNQSPPPLPGAYVHRLRITSDEQVFDLYEYHPD
jgi:hypothetical protein